MTHEEQIGQLLWFGWQADAPAEALTVSSVADRLAEALDQVGFQAARLESVESVARPTIVLAVLPGAPDVTRWAGEARRRLATGARVLVAAVRESYPLAAFDGMQSLLACYGDWDGCLPALAAVLVGRATAERRLPVMLVGGAEYR
jgi:hypothetical protein